MVRPIRQLLLPISNIALIPRPPIRIATVLNRSISASPFLSNKPLPPRLKLDDADITLSYLKGSGPGGQKIVFLPQFIHARNPTTANTTRPGCRTKQIPPCN
jgi:hypothetical protein